MTTEELKKYLGWREPRGVAGGQEFHLVVAALAIEFAERLDRIEQRLDER